LLFLGMPRPAMALYFLGVEDVCQLDLYFAGT
jgi:hypothetical protein